MTNLEITFNATFNHGEIEEFDDITVAVTGELPAEDCDDSDSRSRHDSSMAVTSTAATRICRACRHRRITPRCSTCWETNYGSFTPRVDATYKKDINACFDWASCQWQDGKGMEYDFYALNARLTWLSRDEKIRVTAYGNNLTDNQSGRRQSPAHRFYPVVGSGLERSVYVRC